MKSKYHQLEEGETFKMDLAEEDLKVACCDCGAVHIYTFRHIENSLWELQVFPDLRATGGKRRHRIKTPLR